MNKFISKVVSVGLAAVLMVGSATPVMAASGNVDSTGSVLADHDTANHNVASPEGKDTTQGKQTKYGQYTEDTDATTDVYVTQASNFTVVAPLVATLNGKAGEANTGRVQYLVRGNIASDETITVDPDDSFELSQEGKENINCTVTPDEDASTTFTYADGLRDTEAGTLNAKYTLEAENMTAGSWHGSYNTVINLQNNTEFYDVTSQIEWNSGAYWQRSGYLITDLESWKHAEIKVKPGETYKISAYTSSLPRLYLLKENVDTTENISMFPEAFDEYYSTATYVEKEFTIPEGANYLCLTTSDSLLAKGPFKLEKMSNATINSLGTSFKYTYDDMYMTFTIDDCNADISEYEDVFEELGVPACYAAIPEKLNNTTNSGESVKEVLQRAVVNGGEVLSHSQTPLTSASTDDDYVKTYKTNKETLESNGFTINGIITAGGFANGLEYKTQDFSKSTRYAFSVGYLYGDQTSYGNTNGYYAQFNQSRAGYGTLDAAKASIDQLVAKGSGVVHQFTHGNTINNLSLEDTKALLEYAKSKGVKIVTWNYLYNNCSNYLTYNSHTVM